VRVAQQGVPRLRNIFDQYEQPENRLSHALACCLHEDPRLLRRFVEWATGRKPPARSRLEVIEQGLPGQPEATEDEAERRGLPDLCIHDRKNENWCLIVESKVAAGVSLNQLERHRRTAERHGFTKTPLLLLTAKPFGRKLPHGAIHKQWPELYVWLTKKDSEWARRLRSYFEAAENRMVEEEYLKEGALTMFSGIPFGKDNPYSYLEAKRLLKLAMSELRQRPKLIRELGINPKGGSHSITGKKGTGVWDLLRLKESGGDSFTSHPHFDLGISEHHVFAYLSLPNGLRSSFRRNLLNLGEKRFAGLVEEITRNMLKILRMEPGGTPRVGVEQVHYLSQKGPRIVDATMTLDPRTSFSKKTGKVKPQPEWLQALWGIISRKKSNMQMTVGVNFPYARCQELIPTPKALDLFAGTWLACKPLLDVIMRGRK